MAAIVRAGMRGQARRALEGALRNCQDFTTSGALRGAATHGYRPTLGWLWGDDLDRLILDRDRITYVVWSYETPIAWVLDDGTVYHVRQRFSATTSKHQGALWPLGLDLQ